MKKLLLGLTLLISTTSFAGVRNVCGEARESKIKANESLNETLSQVEYTNAIAKIDIITFIESKEVIIERTGVNSDGVHYRVQTSSMDSRGNDIRRTLYSACILLENI